MKQGFIAAILALYLIVPKMIVSAQTISSQKGLTTAVFNTSGGNIKVYLPDDIRQGDVISGRVVAEPEGRNEKQIARNLAELTRYAIRLYGEKFTVENTAKAIRFTVPARQPMLGSIELMNATGTLPVQQLNIPEIPLQEQKPAPAQCMIPGHVITGSPMTIPGPFDGNAATTQCTIGNQPATVLAESPRSCIVAFPANATGMQQTQVQENGQQPCSKNVSGVEMNVSAGKLNLTRGEKTYIDVSITGLQNLQGTALLLLNNLTTDVVAMQPFNNISVPLVPDSVSSGNFNRRFNVQSIRTGGFTVNVNLDFQDIMLTPIPDETKPADTKNDNKVPQVGNGGKNDPPKMVIEPDDPKNPITWDSIPRDGTACLPSLYHKIGTAIEGGLRNSFIGTDNNNIMQRDDFIVLEADGVDFDLAVKTCTQIEICSQTGCTKEVPIEGRVRFEWKSIEDPKGKPGTRGSFVQIGCIPEDGKAKGEQVIFKPPFIPQASVGNPDTTVFSTIILSVIDAGSPVPDKTLDKEITIAITRTKASPDRYTVKITGGGYKPGKTAATPPPPGCPCDPIGPLWTPGDNLKTPEIILPSIGDDKDKLVLGQKVLLSTQDQTDLDIATYGCTTSCPTTTIKKSYNDIVRWKWKIEKTSEIDMGRILLSDSSQFIVYEAPKVFPDETDFLDIVISVEVHNPPGRTDGPKTLSTQKIFRVYKPGIRVNYTPLTWMPGENNTLELKSELVYKSGGAWLPGLSHMCRIQYFELLSVSREKGVCMNASAAGKNDFCFDLQLKKQSGIEVYGLRDAVAGICELKDQYMQARTERPVKEFTTTIYSLDYGAYGYFRSFANVNYGVVKTDKDTYEDKGRDMESVLYESVHWLKTEVLHPLSAENRIMKTVQEDNRVTIPHDVDENHIADAGWKSINDGTTLIDVSDPLQNNTDEDDLPIGNKTKGDGLTSYEEYRGFKVLLGSDVIFTRTNHVKKDIFIYNKSYLDISLFAPLTGLEVHEVKAENINPDSKGAGARVINFNATVGSPTHIVDQKGLRLVDAGYSKGLLGIACPDNVCAYPGTVAPPNWIYEIWVYTDAIIEKAKAKGYDAKQKLAQVVAHELCHGINICHHGEGDLNKDGDFQKINGLRSGDINCIMRYDNSGIAVLEKKDDKNIPEPIGNKLCTSAVGTGYNETSNLPGFGNADSGRGNCIHQIQVTGFGNKPVACKQ